MAEKRKRAPGGGRKALNPDEAQSVKVMVRIRPALREALQHLADQHDVSLSREIKSALRHWVDRYEKPHNSHLAHTIGVLADGIERLTEHSWMNDPLTRELVREHVEQLVAKLLSPLPGPVTVPAEVKREAGTLLTVLVHATGSRRLAGTVIVDDPELAMLTNDLARKWKAEANVETRPELVARRKQEPKAWADAESAGTAAALTNYLRKFGLLRPDRAAKARERLAALGKKGRK